MWNFTSYHNYIVSTTNKTFGVKKCRNYLCRGTDFQTFFNHSTSPFRIHLFFSFYFYNYFPFWLLLFFFWIFSFSFSQNTAFFYIFLHGDSTIFFLLLFLFVPFSFFFFPHSIIFSTLYNHAGMNILAKKPADLKAKELLSPTTQG